MKKFLKIIWLTWISLLACAALFFGVMIVVQYHNLSLYQKPYLKIPISPPFPKKEVIPLEIKILTEVRTMKVFLVPALKDPLSNWLELSLVSPSGEDWRLLLFPAQCEWEGKNFPACYVSMLRKCRYQLKLKIKEPPSDLPSETTLILAPCSEFGGLILVFYKAGLLAALFLLAGSFIIFSCVKPPAQPVARTRNLNSDTEEPKNREQ